jgi:hypothetical protein
VRRVPADELGADLVERSAHAVEPLAQHAVGHARLLDGVGPGVDQRAHGLVAGAVGDGDLEHVGGRAAAHAVHADAVGAVVLERMVVKSATTSGVM